MKGLLSRLKGMGYFFHSLEFCYQNYDFPKGIVIDDAKCMNF